MNILLFILFSQASLYIHESTTLAITVQHQDQKVISMISGVITYLVNVGGCRTVNHSHVVLLLTSSVQSTFCIQGICQNHKIANLFQQNHFLLIICLNEMFSVSQNIWFKKLLFARNTVVVFFKKAVIHKRKII